MTKHQSGKYGRTIGQKERKAGWPAPATAWCFLCNGTHSWVDGCRASSGRPSAPQPRGTVGSARRVA